MDSMLKKSFDRSRSLLFGLLQGCLFAGNDQNSCPLSQLRSDLSFDEKYDFVMGLSRDEVHNILEQHEKCYEQTVMVSMQEENSDTDDSSAKEFFL